MSYAAPSCSTNASRLRSNSGRCAAISSFSTVSFGPAAMLMTRAFGPNGCVSGASSDDQRVKTSMT